MKLLQSIYRKYYNCISKYIFPAILLIYPLIKCNQGVDVSDSTYSLGNYLFFERLEGTWVVSTYLSNVVGWILTKLPFGTTLLGINIYTGLIVSGLTIGLYFMLRKWMPDWIVFFGEFIAIGFLWIPTGILYNYLTYVFFALGATLLYKGLVEEKKRVLIVAGIMLGLNVWVRIPNLAEMALVVCVWYYCYICKEKMQSALQKTGFCVAGYVIGAVVPFVMILVQYGFGGIVEMVQGLSQIQRGDDSYSIFSMIKMTLDAYVRTGKWVGFIVAGIVLGLAMFFVKKNEYIRVKKALYLLGIAMMLRFFWGRGMFSFRYYEDYSSMSEWGMIGLYLALVACGYLFFAKGVSESERLWGMVSLVVIVITPLGSNNYTYQNLNNLFLVAPITVYAFVKWFRRRYKPKQRILHFPWRVMVSVLAIMILVQSVGFHFNFVFRDGMDGTKRDMKMESPKSVAGMMTTQKNAEELGGLLAYLETEKAQRGDAEAIFYGDCPGLPYLSQIPSAIGNSWPDLDSNGISWMEEELMGLEERPLVVIRKVEPSSDSFVVKKEMLQDYMSVGHYEEVYRNEGYSVYKAIEE